MQDDKETVFGAFDALALSLAAMTGMVETLTFRTDRMRALAASGYSTATDLAAWLVREAGLPFREAHHVVGACVKRSEVLGVEISVDRKRVALGTRVPLRFVYGGRRNLYKTY